MKKQRNKKILIITLAAQILIISTNTYASEVNNINLNEDGNSINVAKNSNNDNDENKDISIANLELEKIENIKSLIEELNNSIKNKEKIEEYKFDEILELISSIEEKEIKESFLNELNILKEENKKLEENPKNNDTSTKDSEIKNTSLESESESETEFELDQENIAENTRIVKTEEEFRSAMENRAIETIIIEEDIVLTSGISINHNSRNLTIKSKGKSVPVWDNKTNTLKTELTNSKIEIEESHSSRYMLSFSNMNITIDGVDFKGNNKNSRALNIYTTEATIINSKFDSFRYSGDGGVIYLPETSTLDIKGSSFNNNIVKGGTRSGSPNNGGAIAAYGDLNIENSYFENNYITNYGYGGAIYTKGNLKINNSYFTKNNIENYGGGAIYANSDSGKSINIENTKFVENKIEDVEGNSMGAGILDFRDADIVTLKNNEFLNNSSNQSNLIYINNSRINIINNKFKNNSIENGYNILRLGSGINLMSIENNEFVNNTSEKSSIFRSYNKDTRLKGNTFVGNNADIGVFSFYNSGSKLELINTISKNNSKLIFSNKEKTSVKIYDSEFVGNKEGIVNLTGKSSNLTIEKSNFIDNKIESDSTINGGLINVKDGENVDISGTDFSNNNIVSNNEILGGLLHLNSKNIVINGGYYKDNKINSNHLIKGGIILLDTLSNSKILNSTFENNTIDSKNIVYGGVINSNLSLNLVENHFNNNKTKGDQNSYGGAVYLKGSGEFRNNNIVGNSANNGAGIYLAEKSSLNMVSGNINKNNATKKDIYDGGFTGQGGGLFAENYSELNIIGTKFDNNIAYTGGAINLFENKDIGSKSKLDKVHIINNESTEFGGGIDLNNSDLLISSGLFENNTSKYGGAIAANINKEKGKLIIDNETLFKENEAKRTGGFLNVHDRSYLIKNNQCSYNMSYEEDLYKKIFIDRTIRMNGNKADKYRFINGFVDEKCAKYKDVLSENIKLNNQSSGACPFNNYDINMLGYEYYVLYKNPENVDGILGVEVYKGDDFFKFKYPIGTEIEAIRRNGTKVEKIKAKLIKWDMKRYNKDGEKDLPKNRILIDHSINKNDIVMEGKWKIDVLSVVEDKLVDYEIKYITEDGKLITSIKEKGKIGEVISADYKIFGDYILSNVEPSNATISLKDDIDNKIILTYKVLDKTTSDEIRIKDINENLDKLEEELYNTGELDLAQIENIRASILLIQDEESRDILNTRVSNIEKVSELIIEIRKDIKKYSEKNISVEEKLVIEKKINKLKDSNIKTILEKSLNEIKVTGETEEERIIREINILLNKLDFDLHDNGLLDIDTIDEINSLLLKLQDGDKKAELENSLNELKNKESKIKRLRYELKRNSNKIISEEKYNDYLNDINKIKTSKIKSILLEKLSIIKIEKDIVEDSETILKLKQEIKELKQEIEDLEKQLSEGSLGEEERNKLKQEIADLEAELKDIENLELQIENQASEIKNLEAEIADLERQLSEGSLGEEERNKLEKEIAELKAELKDIENLESQIEDQANIIKDLDAEIEDLKKQLSEGSLDDEERNELEKEIVGLKQEIEDLKKQLSEGSLGEEERNKLEKEIEGLKTEIEEFKLKLQNAENTIKEKDETIEELNNRIEELKKSLEDGDIIVDDEKIKELEAKIVTLKDEIEKLTTSDSENKEKLLKKTKELNEKLEEIETLNNRIKELEDKISSGWDSTDELNKLKDDIKNLELDNKNINNTLNEKVAKLEEKNNKINSLETEIEKLKEKLKNGDNISEKDLNKLKDELKASKELTKLLQTKVNSLELENKELLNKYLDELAKNKKDSSNKDSSGSSNINKDYSENKTIIENVENLNIDYKDENQEIIDSLKKPIDEKIEETKYKAQLNKDDYIKYLKGYEDKTIRPEEYLTREEVSKILYRLLDDKSREIYENNNIRFNDVENNRWSSKAISTLAKANIIKGYGDGNFRPEKNITRAEVATIIGKFNKLTPGRKDKFADIENHWANKYIVSGVKKGWIKGYDDDTFKPNEFITRAEFVTILNRKLDRGLSLNSTQVYQDLDKDKWYYNEILKATSNE